MARIAGLALLVLALAGCGSAGSPGPRSSAELVNFRLGLDLSHWLVGPVAQIATPEEVREYLAVADDLSAVEFIETFWRRRDPTPADRDNPVRHVFDLRVPEADRLYSEAGILGRRTPRGTIFVLYGEPAEVGFEIAPDGGAPIEVWRYEANAPPGLDGRAPERLYWFRKDGDLTVTYRPGGRRLRVP